MSTEPIPEIVPPVPSTTQGISVPSHSRWRRSWQPLRSRFGRHFAIAAVALGGLAAVGHFVGGFIGWWHLYEVTMHAGKPVLQASTTDAKSRKLPRLSIVVLPLTSEGGAHDGDWFTDGLVTDLTIELGRYSGAEVISRDTAFRYKGRTVDPKEVSRELGVRYVVQGTVRRDGERVRLSLTMVDGESGKQHWAQQFEMDRANLRQSLDEVAGQVGRSLNVQLLRSEGKRAASLAPEEEQADDLAMQGWEISLRGTSRENMLGAQRLFEAAVARDPNSIRGWGGVGNVNWLGAVTGWMPDRPAAIARLRLAAERLQVIDQNDFYTLSLRTMLAGLVGDHEGQLVAAAAWLDRFPNYPHAHFYRGNTLMSLGRFEECIEPAKKAIRLGPLDPNVGTWNMSIANCHFMRGEYRQAAEHARLAVQGNPMAPLRHMTLAASLARDGRMEEARKVMTAFRQGNPEYKAQDITRGMPSDHPTFVEGRNRMIATVRELGLP
jgi:adenylate cyclase